MSCYNVITKEIQTAQRLKEDEFMLNLHENFLRNYIGYFEEIENLGKDAIKDYTVRPEERSDIVHFSAVRCAGVNFSDTETADTDFIAKACGF